MKLSKNPVPFCADAASISVRALRVPAQNQANYFAWPESVPINGGPNEHLGWLVQTIEKSIIPRLLSAHLNTGSEEDAQRFLFNSAEDPEKIALLTQLVLSDEVSAAGSYVSDLHAKGTSLDEIYLRLLAPTARRLGEMWDSDECTFHQVTVGLWRLKQLMYDLSPLFQEFARSNTLGARAILIPMPGSQHTMGLFMVSEFFRRAGWRVWGELANTETEILAAIQTEWFDLIGISVSVQNQFEALTSFITSIRSHSRNPKIGIMVGGPIFVVHPELIKQVGADITGVDAEQALEQAEILLTKIHGRHPNSP
ncbi:COG5012 Predicted cobalamin binding protein [Burkholderiaceae bacterium]